MFRSHRAPRAALAILAAALLGPAPLLAGLTVEADADRPSRVFLDDVEVGTTPLTLSEIEPGEHQVRFQEIGGDEMYVFVVRSPSAAHVERQLFADYASQAAREAPGSVLPLGPGTEILESGVVAQQLPREPLQPASMVPAAAPDPGYLPVSTVGYGYDCGYETTCASACDGGVPCQSACGHTAPPCASTVHYRPPTVRYTTPPRVTFRYSYSPTPRYRYRPSRRHHGPRVIHPRRPRVHRRGPTVHRPRPSSRPGGRRLPRRQARVPRRQARSPGARTSRPPSGSGRPSTGGCGVDGNGNRYGHCPKDSGVRGNPDVSNRGRSRGHGAKNGRGRR